jgi:hypothetical protein
MLRPAGGARFQDLFHSPCRGAFHHSLTVLVHYRSPAVFSLGWWSTPLPTRYHVSGGTHAIAAPRRLCRRLRGSHPLRPPVPVAFGRHTRCGEGSVAPSQPSVLPPPRQRRLARTPVWFGLLPVRSPLLRESSLLLRVLRCFSSPRAPRNNAVPGVAPGGLPHSEISGSPAASASPEHFAAWPRPSSAAGAKASTMRPSS